jgi:hypothetical protein
VKNLPWWKFYVRDWRNDTKLKACSLLSRGFWFEVLCAMYESDTSTLSGSPEQLSRIVGCDVADVQSAISDLQASGAADIAERNGVVTLTNRRRKRDEQSRVMANERLKKHRCNAKSNARETGDAGSVSDSDSGIPGNGDARGKGPDDGDLPYTFDASDLPTALKTPEFLLTWPEWVGHRGRKASTRLNRRSARMQLCNLAEWGSERAVIAIRHSIAGAYQGIFEPKTAAKAAPKVSADSISAIANKVTKGAK